MCATVAAGGDRGERGGGQVEHDPALLPRHLHPQLQEDHRRRLPREASQVRRVKQEGNGPIDSQANIANLT